MLSALKSLKSRALEYRKKRSQSQLLDAIGKLSTFFVGVQAFASLADWLSRPNCFGEFYYQDPTCKGCSYKPGCKVEKARRSP